MTSANYLIKQVKEQLRASGNPYEDLRGDRFGVRDWKETPEQAKVRQELALLDESIRVLQDERSRLLEGKR